MDVVAGSIVALVVRMWVEIKLMPVDVAKAYFEIQQLREEIRKVEFALNVSFARPPNRPLPHRAHERPCPQATNPPMPIAKQGQN
ncbi:hypothetical protein ACF1BQ_004620 [Bradyrhizobium sp. RDT10]